MQWFPSIFLLHLCFSLHLFSRHLLKNLNTPSLTSHFSLTLHSFLTLPSSLPPLSSLSHVISFVLEACQVLSSRSLYLFQSWHSLKLKLYLFRVRLVTNLWSPQSLLFPTFSVTSRILQSQLIMNHRSYPTRLVSTRIHSNWISLYGLSGFLSWNHLVWFSTWLHPPWFSTWIHPTWFSTWIHPTWFSTRIQPNWLSTLIQPIWFLT